MLILLGNNKTIEQNDLGEWVLFIQNKSVAHGQDLAQLFSVSPSLGVNEKKDVLIKASRQLNFLTDLIIRHKDKKDKIMEFISNNKIFNEGNEIITIEEYVKQYGDAIYTLTEFLESNTK